MLGLSYFDSCLNFCSIYFEKLKVMIVLKINILYKAYRLKLIFIFAIRAHLYCLNLFNLISTNHIIAQTNILFAYN